MGSVSVQGVTKQFGSQIVLDNVSLDINSGETIGMVGPNGAGKTTLFKIIAGLMEPDTGTVTSSRGLQIGYLAQDPDVDSSRTLYDEVSSVFSGLFALEQRLHSLSEQMAADHGSGKLDELMHEYDRVNAQFIAAGGYAHEQKLSEILGGLGFSQDDRSLPVSALSGGQRCRAALAKLLLQDRQLLLLDEPTNHLDIDAVRWLEKFLAGHHGGAVIISHDRYLLDRLADKIVEVDRRKTSSFPGNYSTYAKAKALRELTLERQYEKDAEFIEKERAFIAKHLAGQRTKEAQGRRARLERRIAAGGFVLEKPEAKKKLKLSFGDDVQENGTVMRVDNLSKRYGDKVLFSALDVQVDAGKRLGITGPNGTGKTTLLRILLDKVAPDDGEFEFQSKTSIGYYSQDAEGLHPENTVLEEIVTSDNGLTEQSARSLLGSFNFKGNDVFKKQENLSGGEQSRLRLIKLLLSAPNVLVLDEPTNHLDIASREALEEALDSFPGVIITVSHDRYFLDKIADQLLVIRPNLHEHCLGNYSDYIKQKDAQQAVAAQSKEPGKGKKTKRGKKEAKQSGPTSKFDSYSIDALEETIVEHEELLAEMTEQFADPELGKDSEALAELQEKFARIKEELALAEQAWSERAENL